MSRTNRIIWIHFLILIIGTCLGDTFISKLPNKVIEASSTEEMWVYFPKPTPTTNLYIFYQKGVSQVQITSSDASLVLTYYELPTKASPSNIALGDKKEARKTLAKVIGLNRWIHIAVTKGLDYPKPKKLDFRLYVNGNYSYFETEREDEHFINFADNASPVRVSSSINNRNW